MRSYTDWALKYVSENPEKRDYFYFNNDKEIGEIIRIPERFRELF